MSITRFTRPSGRLKRVNRSGLPSLFLTRQGRRAADFELALKLFKQLLRLWRTLPRCQLQPVAGLLRFIVARLTIELAELQLSPHITGAGGLAQQFKTDAPITWVAAITAEHLPKPTLCLHYALQGRLLEQVASKAFDAGGMTESRAVQ